VGGSFREADILRTSALLPGAGLSFPCICSAFLKSETMSLKRIIKKISGIYRQRAFQLATITLAIIFLSSAGVFYFEETATDSNIRSFWDGVWWSVVTMGTVGYGDRYPVSPGGRIVGLLLIFSGVGLMSLFTATIASMFVEQRIKEGRGLEKIKETDHVVICGWNQYTENVLLGLTTYGTMEDSTIVFINELPMEKIDALKLKYHRYNLKFLRGNYVHEDVLLRANIKKARFAMIMADLSGGNVMERIDEKTTLAALKSLAPQVKTIAEILDAENRPHLKRANVDEIIVRGEHVGSLLASAVNSPGLPKLMSNILALGDSNKFRRIDIPHEYVGKTFKDLSAYYREKSHAILIGLLKDKKTMKLEDLLTDNTSMIDTFIREKIRESKKEFFYDRDEAHFVINPPDDHLIAADDHAVILSRGNLKKT
jgi:voltage-gated potassium channel